MSKENENTASWRSVLTPFAAIRRRRGRESNKQLSNISPIKFKSRRSLVGQPSLINKDGINQRRRISSFTTYF